MDDKSYAVSLFRGKVNITADWYWVQLLNNATLSWRHHDNRDSWVDSWFRAGCVVCWSYDPVMPLNDSFQTTVLDLWHNTYVVPSFPRWSAINLKHYGPHFVYKKKVKYNYYKLVVLKCLSVLFSKNEFWFYTLHVKHVTKLFYSLHG